MFEGVIDILWSWCLVLIVILLFYWVYYTAFKNINVKHSKNNSH